MRIVKTLGAIGLAGALTVAAATPSSAGNEWGYAAGGFAVGALVGAAAANANARAYYGSPYYNSYAYEPTYVAPAPAYTYAPAPVYSYGYSEPAYVDTYAYAPGPRYVAPRRAWGCYNVNDCKGNRERQLTGTD